MKLASRELKHGLMLGPMAGVTDKVFRDLCVEQGCEYTITEMVSAKAIYYKNNKTSILLEQGNKESYYGIQLFGNEPDLLADMAMEIDHPGILAFDVNMGCPVPKVVNNGEGSALMKNPKLIGKIINTMVKKLDKPVTIKIRAGFTDEHINAVEICKVAEANGASMVVIHGRTRDQYYSGKADWDVIRDAKKAVSIPIIGNGDVVNGSDIIRIIDHTNCDGVMVGRGAMGNPWVFKELIAALESKEYIPPTIDEIVTMIHRHGQLLADHKGEYIAMREMRKHVSWYTKGLPNATHLREQINKVETLTDLENLVNQVMLTD